MAKTYKTNEGDTWDSIAFTQLGSSFYSNQIMNQNLKYADTIIFSTGTILTIPDIIVTEQSKVNLPPWKR